jgi:hypothetical protein
LFLTVIVVVIPVVIVVVAVGMAANILPVLVEESLSASTVAGGRGDGHGCSG